MVRLEELESSSLSAADFKSAVFTYFTIDADNRFIWTYYRSNYTCFYIQRQHVVFELFNGTPRET